MQKYLIITGDQASGKTKLLMKLHLEEETKLSKYYLSDADQFFHIPHKLLNYFIFIDNIGKFDKFTKVIKFFKNNFSDNSEISLVVSSNIYKECEEYLNSFSIKF